MTTISTEVASKAADVSVMTRQQVRVAVDAAVTIKEFPRSDGQRPDEWPGRFKPPKATCYEHTHE